MFRTQQNAFDDSVAKATDENLTSENWEYILDVCDRVNTSDSGGKDAVAAIIKRLSHRNANVQLYTLEVANALSQNCGIKIHRELSSKSFTDCLLRIAGDRTTHQAVKSKILERMEEWTQMFKSNPELGIMESAFYRLKSSNPNLQPPQAPQKAQITDYDRKKEEEELQMALKLSIADDETRRQQQSRPAELSTVDPPAQVQNTAGYVPPSGSAPAPVQGTTAATVSRVRALFDFVPSEPGELQFRKGDVIAVIESVYKDWWKGSLRGTTGIFPLNYVEKLQDPTQEDLQREAEMEAEVFGQMKNVEKLLALLSTNTGDISARENEEITELYHGTLAIRPKLIELIGKYTQKKDDFQQLNEKFIKARRDYESLLETSMAQSAMQYGRPQSAMYPGYPPQQPQRFFTADGQPPNAGYPAYPQPQAASAQTGFQPPYPVSSPPLQSQAPYQQPQRQASQSSSMAPQVYEPQEQAQQGVYQYQPPTSHKYPEQPPQVQQLQQQITGQSQHAGSAYSLHDQDHTQQSLQQQSTGSYPPPGQAPPQQSGYPPSAANPQSQTGYSTQQYQAYAPQHSQQPPHQTSVGYAGGGDVSNFYR